jgi:signal transduction histidine kinase
MDHIRAKILARSSLPADSGARAAAVLAAVLLVTIFTLRQAVTAPGFGFSLLYVVPIALLAVAYGVRGGVAAATLGLVLFAVGDATEPVLSHGVALYTNVIGYLSHAVTYYLLAGLVGWYSDRVRRIGRLLQTASDAASVARNDFLSRMSHELRTPLAAILGFSEMLGWQELDLTTRHRVETIEKAGLHLMTLVTEVLDLSCIDAGESKMSIEALAVAPVLAESLAMMESYAGTAGILLTEAVVASDCHYLLGDVPRLKQVMLNLISNAIKYNSVGGEVRIEVGSAPQSGEAGAKASTVRATRISVSDDGPGLDAAALSKLFVPFERLGASATTVEGTGLGLSLSKAIVGRMGGTLGADSTVGEGSTFWIDLETAEATEATAGPTSPH